MKVARRRLGGAAGLGLVLKASCALAAAPSTPAAGPLSFLGAYVGMPREAWAALPPLGGRAAEVQCAASPTASRRDPAMASNPASTSDDETCAYVRRYGHYALPVTVRLSNGLQATHLRYTFEDGRLQRIGYQLSVDAYDRLMSELHTRLGAADQVQRDAVRTDHGALPRVSQTWRISTGLVQVIDPVPPYSTLQVRLSAVDQPLSTAAPVARTPALASGLGNSQRR